MLYLVDHNSALGSNTANPGQSNSNWQSFHFFEKTYTTTGAQEWIYLSDAGVFGVTISFPVAGSGIVEMTTSPPDIAMAGQAVNVQVGTGTISTSTTYIVQGATAIRLNIATGTQVKLSIRG